MATTKVVGADVLKARIMSFIEAMNAHDIDKILSHMTRDVVWTESMEPEPLVGKPAVRAGLEESFAAFPDMHLPIEDIQLIVPEGATKAAATFTVICTMTGHVGDFAPTGRTGRVSGVCVYDFRGDHIARHTIVYDGLDMAQQLGLLPSPTGFPMRMLVGVQRFTNRVTGLVRR